MFAKLLSGELIALTSDTPIHDQLSQRLGVPQHQIHVEPAGEEMVYVVVSDFNVEWIALPLTVLDTRAYFYRKFECVVNGVSYDVYEKEDGGYGLAKKYGHQGNIEVIYPIRESMSRDQMEHHLLSKK